MPHLYTFLLFSELQTRDSPGVGHKGVSSLAGDVAGRSELDAPLGSRPSWPTGARDLATKGDIARGSFQQQSQLQWDALAW